MTHIIDIRALQGAGRSGVEVYIEGFLREFLLEKKVNEVESVILWVNAANDVILPNFITEYTHLENVHLVNTKIPNKIFNITCSLLRWPKIDKLKGIKRALDGLGEIALWVLDSRPAPVSNGVKKYIVVHDLSAIKFPHFFSLRAKLWFKVVRLRKELDEAVKIYAVSKFTKLELIGLNPTLENKIIVKYPLLNSSNVCKKFEAKFLEWVKAKYFLPQGKYLLSLSTLEPRKNIESLIQKFLNGDFPNYEYLVIAGKANRRIFGKTQYLNDPRIIFTGFVLEDEKWPVYHMASGFACLSKYEGYGIPVKEAMEYGLSLILSDIPAFREVTDQYKDVTWVKI